MRWIVVLVLWAAAAHANAPAPWAVCDGKQAGDSCSSMYYPFGRCEIDPYDCKDKGPCLACRANRGYGDMALAGAAFVIGVGALIYFTRRSRRTA